MKRTGFTGKSTKVIPIKQLIRDVMEVNGVSRKEFDALVGMSPKVQRDQNALQHNRKFITAVIRSGLRLPYVHRVICRKCLTRFTPHNHWVKDCPNCKLRPTEVVDLSPEDCKEIGMSFDKANTYLHLPESYREWYNSLVIED